MLHKLLSYGRKNRRGVILLLVSLLALWWGYTPLMAFVRWISDRQAVIEFIQGYGAWGVVLYILLMILQLFVAFIPGQALAIAAGYVFGFFPAVGITIPVAVAGSQLAFHLTRRYGRPLAYRFISPKTIERWEKISSRQGVMFYFFAFILPIFPRMPCVMWPGWRPFRRDGFLLRTYWADVFRRSSPSWWAPTGWLRLWVFGSQPVW